MVLRIRLLGPLELDSASGASIGLPTRKAEALLAVLARHPGRRHGRERLAALLWPESTQAGARTSLRQTLAQLRRALLARGPEPVRAEADSLALEPSGVEVDAARFEALHDAGTRAALTEAAALYRGDFLEGFSPPAEPFAEWLTFERMRLRERAVAVLSALLPDDAGDSSSEQAIQTAVRLLELDPLQESVHRLLMRLYLAQGRRGAALEQYRFCRAALRRELGAEPEAETEALGREIREQSHPVSTATPGAVQGDAPAHGLLAGPVVAVLPFANLSPDPDQRYFSDGVSEDIITALAGWRRFPLIASASTFGYRDPARDPRRVADELGARYVVDGSVRRAGGRARISARLVDADSGHVFWAERFDLALADILAAQDECAARIAAAIEPALEGAELNRIVTKRTEDLSAWERFLQGRSFLGRFTLESHVTARMWFERAIELDRGYSDAFAGLAQSDHQDVMIGGVTEREERLARAFETAREAAALDPNSSDAHLRLGTAYVWREEFDSAMAETELAVELNPSNAHARLALGNRLDLVGCNAEGIAQLERGLQLNPRDPRCWVYMGFLSRAHLDAGHYREALSWARQAVRVREDQPDAHFRLAVCAAHAGRAAEARAALAECDRLRSGFLAAKAGWRPYADPARSEHYFAGLRRLGLMG